MSEQNTHLLMTGSVIRPSLVSGSNYMCVNANVGEHEISRAGGWFQVEQLAYSTRMSGWFGSEWLTGFLWNTWLILTGIRSQTHLRPTEGCMTALWRGDPGAEFPYLAVLRPSVSDP